ncbi:hypothetical protein ACH42_15425 [Endozoicomonas sp. (ex Bugula neritina AB1)]|nr:hypothetical protein ACH42_15425 [Endozoicomonas sp. (ex Bugula neritina AB1)]
MLFADPVVKTSILAAAEKSLNALLALDPVMVDRLSVLAGTVIELRCLEPDYQCFIRLEDGFVRLAGYNEGAIDAAFSGSAACLARLAHSRNVKFADVEGLVITGQSEIVEQLQAIHCDMELDWERLVIRVLGETPGHMLAQGARMFSRQIQQGHQMCDQNLADYLREELQLIPSPVEIEQFSDQVSLLQTSVTHLSEQINSHFPSESDSSDA